MGQLDAAHWREGVLTGEPGAMFEMSRYAWFEEFPEFYSHPDYKAMLAEFGLDLESRSKITVPKLPF